MSDISAANGNLGEQTGNSSSATTQTGGATGSVTGIQGTDANSFTTLGTANLSVVGGDASAVAALANVSNTLTGAETQIAGESAGAASALTGGLAQGLVNQTQTPVQQLGGLLIPLALVAALGVGIYFLSKGN